MFEAVDCEEKEQIEVLKKISSFNEDLRGMDSVRRLLGCPHAFSLKLSPNPFNKAFNKIQRLLAYFPVGKM